MMDDACGTTWVVAPTAHRRSASIPDRFVNDKS